MIPIRPKVASFSSLSFRARQTTFTRVSTDIITFYTRNPYVTFPSKHPLCPLTTSESLHPLIAYYSTISSSSFRWKPFLSHNSLLTIWSLLPSVSIQSSESFQSNNSFLSNIST